MRQGIHVLIWLALIGASVPLATPAAVGSGPESGLMADPVTSISVEEPASTTGWQARLHLAAVPDELRVTLNGKRVEYLFNPGLLVPQVARLAPDDGLHSGRNVLRIGAVYRNHLFPVREVVFKVPRQRPLASAGQDRRVRLLTRMRLDGRRSRGLAPRWQGIWELVRAPAGSRAMLKGSRRPRPSFTPDVNGTYQIRLTVRSPRTGATSTDMLTVLTRPNFKPIGVGIETLAVLPDGDHAIVIGGNCTPELMGCPDQQQTYPFGGKPVQLLILDRATLEPLFSRTYAGTANDAKDALKHIQQTYWSGDSIVPSALVILAAVDSRNAFNAPIDPSFETTLAQILSAPVSGNRVANVAMGGWSAIGMRAPGQTVVPPGPTGYVNPGRNNLEAFDYTGNITGYLQYNPLADPLLGNTYSFTAGDFASFNTSLGRTATTNVMRIDGNDYSSPPLTAADGTPCSGGFHVVTLRAAFLSPPRSSSVPVNQAIGTHCGEDAKAVHRDQQQLTLLQNALSAILDDGADENGLLVFLQSIGNPIRSHVEVRQQAAAAVSPLLEQLGGYADAFNKSWEPPPANSPPGYTPGYVLAGSTILLGDAPKGGPPGVYAPESSAAAALTENGLTGPVFLNGLLKRNERWHYTPEFGGPVAPSANADNSLDLTEPGFLAEVVYRTAAAWNAGETPGEQAVLAWFSNQLGLSYTQDSSCYLPAQPNVRAEYCDTNPIGGGGAGWAGLLPTVKKATWSDARRYCQKVQALAPICTRTDFDHVRSALMSEIPLVGYVSTGILRMQGIFGSATIDGMVDLNGVTQNVIDAVDQSLANSGNTSVTGFLFKFASILLGAVGGAVDPELLPAVAGFLGAASTSSKMAGDLFALGDGTNAMGQIIATDASELGEKLAKRYQGVTNALGLYADIIFTDFGKLNTFSGNTLFQSNLDNKTRTSIEAYLGLAAQRYVYGRLLAGIYQSYGLLPVNQGVERLKDPAQYECPTGNDFDTAYPFKTSQAGSWFSLSLPESLGPYGPFSGSPDILVLAFPDDNYLYMASVPGSIMQTVTTPTYKGGLGEWPIWFFRRNFNQITYHCDL